MDHAEQGPEEPGERTVGSERVGRVGPVDRRRRPTRSWDVLFTPGRRHWHRRAGDAERHPVLDRHGSQLRWCAFALLSLTLLDGLLTLRLIDSHCDEANPIMAHVMKHHGSLAFVLGKYALTAMGLSLLIIWKNHRMFGTAFRVKYFLPIIVGLYLALTSCQVWAIYSPDGPVRRAAEFGDVSRFSGHLGSRERAR